MTDLIQLIIKQRICHQPPRRIYPINRTPFCEPPTITGANIRVSLTGRLIGEEKPPIDTLIANRSAF